MKFKNLTNIETALHKIKLMAIVYFALCTIVTSVAIVSAFLYAEKQRERIYVLDQGKSLILALSQDINTNRPAQARDHVTRFHELFFTLAPDRALIEDNINKALHLADKSAYRYYIDLNEKSYYQRLIATGTHQYVSIEEIDCNFDVYPYQFRVVAKQTIVRESIITERRLVTTCTLINTTRSDNNPHGFTIEKFVVVENTDINQYRRRQ